MQFHMSSSTKNENQHSTYKLYQLTLSLHHIHSIMPQLKSRGFNYILNYRILCIRHVSKSQLNVCSSSSQILLWSLLQPGLQSQLGITVLEDSPPGLTFGWISSLTIGHMSPIILPMLAYVESSSEYGSCLPVRKLCVRETTRTKKTFIIFM